MPTHANQPVERSGYWRDSRERQVFEEIRSALKTEHHDQRNQRRVERIVLSRGRRQPGRSKTVYKFGKAKPGMLPEGPSESIELTFDDGIRLRAKVLSQDPHSLVVDLGQAYGETTPPACIYWDPAWILERLHDSLKIPHFQHPLALSLLGLRRDGPRLEHPLRLPHDELDAEQRDVLRYSTSGGYTLVAGPPGTGKTRWVVQAIREMRARGDSVLVVAPSNRTADLIAARMRPFMQTLDESRELGYVVRLGTVQSSELLAVGDETMLFGEAAGLLIVDGRDADATLKAIKKADVLITTLARTWVATGGLPRDFDSVIVDEASMAFVPAILSALSRVSHRAIVVGDYRQLGPIVHSQDPLVDRWLRRCAFQVAAQSHTSRILALLTQYRMRPGIAGLVSDLSYRGRLRTAPEVFQRPATSCSLGTDDLYLIDTSHLPKHPGATIQNPMHAAVAAALSDLMHPTSVAEGSMEVALISRFRKQVALTSREVRKGTIHSSSVAASTVHSFQGSEAPAVVFDLCAAPGSFLGDYLTDAGVTSDGGRLLTVALSRARERLAVIANLRYLTQAPAVPRDAAARRMLGLLQERATIIPAEDVLALHSTFLKEHGR